MEVCGILLNTNSPAVDSAMEAVVAESKQTNSSVPKEVYEEGIDTDSTKD